MSAKSFFEKFLSFINCFEPNDYIEEKPNLNNKEYINQKNLSYHKADGNHHNISNIIDKRIDLDKSFHIDIIEERKIDKIDDLPEKTNGK